MARSTDRTHKLYAGLEPDERFRLAITALGRGDFAEWRHLSSTHDPAFRERREELRSMMWWFLWQASVSASHLQTLDAVSATLDLLRHETADPPNLRELVMDQAIEEVARTPARRLRALSDAYVGLGSERFGLARSTMLATVYPSLSSALQRFADLIEEAEPTEDERAEARAELEAAMEPLDRAGIDKEAS